MSLRTPVRSIWEACATARAASPASAKGGQGEGPKLALTSSAARRRRFINFHRRRFLVSMALTNAQNQARWREENIEKRHRAQRIAIGSCGRSRPSSMWRR